MNMRRYYHLLNLRRSKGLLMSQKRGAHQTSPVESHHLQPPSMFSSFGHISRNIYTRNLIGSHGFFRSTHSLINSDPYSSRVSTIHTSELPLPEDDSAQLDYRVTVKGREVISAALKPANEHWLPLSNLDLLLPPIEVGTYFCYKKKNMSPEVVVDILKKSLAGVLSTFYPLAGEIVQNSHGEPEVLCNNSGVEFVHAHADVELKDLDFYHPDLSVKRKLVPKINRGLLSIQVTELKCGSIIISGTVNHQLSDGYSMNKFLVAWAKHARLGQISSVPSFRPSILNPRHPPHYETSLDNLYIPITSLPPPSSFEEPLGSRMYYVRAESIERMQSEASTKEDKRSKLLAFTAYIWKLLAAGSNDVENTISRMGVVVNGRRFLTEINEKNSSLFENHYGNVLSIPYGVAAISDLKKMPLHEIGNLVHGFVANTTNEEHFRGLIDWVELHRPTQAVAKIYFGHEKADGRAVVVSGGQGLPINDMDFGWGKPEFGSYYVPWGSRTGYISPMPSATGNGDWVVYMHLKENEFQVIERMAPNVFTPLSIATLI
ncbi:coniferyl alcohol acyltransferase-like [Bidens hawaiensis]|uniref:coniferyl alcohol acyltransferase-like n=1 Tax=Bidens hawaiensis TaxID=980011 RepID=UPI00404A162D